MTFDHAYHRWSLAHAAVLTAGTLLVAMAQLGGDGTRAARVASIGLPVMAGWSAVALAGLYLASRRLRSGGAGADGRDTDGAGARAGGNVTRGGDAAAPDTAGLGAPGHWIPDALTAVRGIAAVALLWALPGVGQWSLSTVWAVGFTLALVELTDFFDGRVARRFGPSAFGAVWDMENDALFTLSLSLLVYLRYGLSPFLLLLGLMRYLYVLVWRFDSDPVTVSPAYKLFAKTTAAAIVVTLIVAVAPLLPALLRSAALTVVLGMQLVSFGWDLALQYRALRLSGTGK